MASSNYKELLVWQKARLFIKRVYEVTASFPPDERFGMTPQVRRAAVSILAHLAEGYAPNATREFAHCVSIAFGSASELEALLLISGDLGYLDESETDRLMADLDEILRMLNSLRQSLRSKAAA